MKDDENKTPATPARATQGAYHHAEPPAIEKIAMRFVKSQLEFEEAISEVAYFLERLPDARGLQPEARTYAEKLRITFNSVTAAVTELRKKMP